MQTDTAEPTRPRTQTQTQPRTQPRTQTRTQPRTQPQTRSRRAYPPSQNLRASSTVRTTGQAGSVCRNTRP